MTDEPTALDRLTLKAPDLSLTDAIGNARELFEVLNGTYSSTYDCFLALCDRRRKLVHDGKRIAGKVTIEVTAKEANVIFTVAEGTQNFIEIDKDMADRPLDFVLIDPRSGFVAYVMSHQDGPQTFRAGDTVVFEDEV